jgi:hypothetical protein
MPTIYRVVVELIPRQRFDYGASRADVAHVDHQKRLRFRRDLVRLNEEFCAGHVRHPLIRDQQGNLRACPAHLV